jgi:LysR family glycine cleavage system transcriptional activator
VSPKLRPEWLAVKTVEDLIELPVITADADGLWGVWLRMAGVEPSLSVRGPNMPNTHIMMEAATYGQGVALVNDVIARKAIADGEIAEILETNIRFHGYYISGPMQKWDLTPVVDVRQWLHELIAA